MNTLLRCCCAPLHARVRVLRCVCCRAGFQMLVALIVIAISLARMVPAPAWLGWYTLAFILLFDSAYAWSCKRPHLCHASPRGCLLSQKSEECRPLQLVGSGIALAALEIL